MVFKMKNWKQKEFGQFVNLRKDKYQPTPGQSIPCVELECITKNSGEITHTISSVTLSSIKNHFSKGDVLFGKLRPYLRKYALPQHDGVCSTEIWVLHPKEGFCSPEFLFLLIQSNKFIYTANLSCGSRMPRADWNLVSSTPFLLPELPEQQKIVEVLETWDKAIQLTRKLIEQKELQKKYLMQQLLSGRIRLKGFVTPWRKTILGNLLKEKSLRNKDLAITRVLSVTNDRGFVLPQEQFSRQVASKNVSNYKVVLRGEFAYNPSRINVGSISFLATFEFGILSPMYVVFSCSEQILPQYFKYWIKTYEFISKVKNAAQGSVRATVDFQNLSTIKMNYPANIKEQLEISKVLSQADKEIDLLRQKLAKLEEQKKGLMQVLLTGQVRLQVGK